MPVGAGRDTALQPLIIRGIRPAVNFLSPQSGLLAIWALVGLIDLGRAETKPSQANFSATALLQRTTTLASDEFEGRGPGTHGEERTTAWLVDQFKTMGLQPGNPDGSWFQEVPMVGMKSVTQFTLRHGTADEALTFPQDFVAWAPPQRDHVTLTNSELVFVGYGVVAPEYGWDDFKDVDVRGKTVVFLINDPPIPDPHDPAKLDDAMFKGKAMTYYGRWTYKFEIAAKKGAAAALIIHETKPAAYPWFVVVNSWGRERFDLDPNPEPQVQIAAWLSLERAQKLFAAAGTSYEAAKRSALRRDFRPQPLGFTADFDVTNTLRHVRSKNVVAKLDGADAKLRNEWLIYTAHWDHLGRDENLTGDQIFNGASDNAIGTAGLLGLAEAFAQSPAPPKRSVLFLAVTAEEQGLLGAKFYAARPLHPLDHTLANINMDGLNTWGRTRDFAVVGLGNSTLDDVMLDVAREQGRVMKPEAMPEKGTFYRSDHFEFAKVGVPALYTKGGMDFIGKPEGYGQRKADEYTERDYHKVSDDVKPDWDLAGVVEDLQLLFQVGQRVANNPVWPEWKPGTEFKARRDEMLKPTR